MFFLKNDHAPRRKRLRGRHLWWLLLPALAGPWFWWLLPDHVITLKPGRPLEVFSPPKVSHRYRFRARAGWFAELYLHQRGVDLELTLHTPFGKGRHERDSLNAGNGGELISLITEETGLYVLEVKAMDPSQKGGYSLTLKLVERVGEPEKIRARAFALCERAAADKVQDCGAALLSARRWFEDAERLWRENGDAEQGALMLLEQAAICGELHQTDRQRELLQAAAESFEAMGQPAVAGLVYHNLGALFYRRSLLDQAIGAYHRALEFRRTADRDRAVTLTELALVHLVIGEMSDFHSCLQEAEQIFTNLNDTNGLANLFLQRGRRCLQLERWQEAVDAFEGGLALLAGSGDKLQLTLLIEMGKALAHGEGQQKRALAVFDEVESLSERLGFISMEWRARSRVNRAEVLLNLGRFQEALEQLESSLAFFEQGDHSKEQVHILFILARAFRASGDPQKALTYMEAALTVSDRWRAQTSSRNIGAAFISAHFFYMDFYLELLMQLGEADERFEERAFLRLELTRARNQVENLNRATASIKDKENLESAEHVLGLQREIAALAWQDHETGDGQGVLDRRLDRLLWEYEGALNGFEVHQPSPPPAQWNLARMRRLLDPQSTLLFYAFGETNCWLWLLDMKQFKAFKLGARATIEKIAHEYYSRLKRADPKRFQPRIDDLGEKLSGWLAAPVAELIEGKRLLIAADGVLNCIPFGALPHPLQKELALTEKHEIVYVPSMRVLELLRERAATRRPAQGGTVIFAAPEYHPNSGFPPLRGSLREARAVSALAPGTTTIYDGFSATKKRVLEGACERARYIHFGAHGLINLNRAELSALVLATAGPDGQYIDGFLNGYEIRQCRLSADLVVLSACRSAMGRNYRGEGLVGLGHDFLEAGAQGLVVSLWDVEDQASEAMMTRFYEHLYHRGRGPAAALRSAQTWMRQSERWQAPFYWAGFIFLGDWRISVPP